MKVVEIAKLMDKMEEVVSEIEEALKQKSKYYAYVKTELSKHINVFDPENIEYLTFCKMCSFYNELIEEDDSINYMKALDAIDFIDRYIEKMYSDTLDLTGWVED